ncbi:MAG: Na+/H+ antiporter NhaA [Rikenellaceae bacterium]
MRYISKYSWVRYRYEFGERSRSLFREPWAGGVVLVLCVIIALLLANLESTREWYHAILTADLSFNITSHNGLNITFPEDLSVEKFINDGLMVIFFFGVGLEIKREVMTGQLSSFRRAILPVIAALGGMIIPALIYTIFNNGTPTAGGWGIPTATDIAFAIGIMSILGDKVPLSLKIFLTALAIADDLGAIIVIAVFYGGAINWGCLIAAFVIMIILYFMNRLGESRLLYYLFPAIVVWSLFYYSGIHATLAGVLMAILVPTKPRYSKLSLLRQSERIEANIVEATKIEDDELYQEKLVELGHLSYGSVSMSHALESILAPYITFVILPIFALANAGVVINLDDLNIFAVDLHGGSIGMGIFFGLMLGKPLGIFIASWAAIKLKLAEMPEDSSWRMIFAVACLGGIGFTMSIFVDTLAFGSVSEMFVDQGKIAILFGSLASVLLGVLLINIFAKRNNKQSL